MYSRFGPCPGAPSCAGRFSARPSLDTPTGVEGADASAVRFSGSGRAWP